MNACKVRLIPAIALVLSLGAGTALAQTPAPTMPAPPNTMAPAMKMKKPAMTADQKASVSKACSTAADQKKLKGKERKKFREDCKRHGGPM